MLAVWQLGRSMPQASLPGLTLLAYVCLSPDSFLSGMARATEELALDLQPSLFPVPQEKLRPQEL